MKQNNTIQQDLLSSQASKDILDLDESIIEHPPLEKKRWLILFAFCTLTFSNASSFVAFSAILDQAEVYFDVSQGQILWFSNVYYIIFIAGCMFTVPIWDRRFDINLYISSFLNAVGGITRYLGGDNYTTVMIGTVLICIAQTWILAAPAIISERWFGTEEKIVALSIGFFSNVMGLSYGYLTGAFMVDEAKVKSEVLDNQFHDYMLLGAITMGVPFIFNAIFVRNSPKILPNIEDTMHKKLSMMASIKKCYFNLKNLVAISCLSLYLGISWTFEAILDVILNEYSTKQIGYIGLTMNTAGTVGGLLSSLYIERQLRKGVKPNYDLLLKIFSTISFVLTIVLTIVLATVNYQDIEVIIFILCGLIGLGFNAFVPIAAESMLETVYPVSEIVGFTIFNQTANILGFAGNLLSNVGLWVICVIMAPLYVYLMFFYKTKENRRQTEVQLKKTIIEEIHHKHHEFVDSE